MGKRIIYQRQLTKKDKMELEYILYELGHEELTKNKYRSQRRYKKRIVRKNNIRRIKEENYDGPEDKPDSMRSSIPSKHKRIMRKRRRAKEAQATKNGKEIFFKKDNCNWY